MSQLLFSFPWQCPRETRVLSSRKGIWSLIDSALKTYAKSPFVEVFLSKILRKTFATTPADAAAHLTTPTF